MAKSSQKRLIIANWKMYVSSPEQAKDFARRLPRRKTTFSGVEVGIAPSFVLIPAVVAALKGSGMHTGGQTLAVFDEGAHTGEVSGEILKNSGADFCIVGHSERRAIGETDADVAEKLKQAYTAGLRAVLCIGEKERDQGGSHFEVLARQLSLALAPISKGVNGKTLVVAYEPVWAIGKTAGDAMKPADVRETSIFIRKELVTLVGRDAAMRVPIIYGGSVEAENASALIMGGDVAGFLVGHASADLDSFFEILKACRK